ncbi:uncharacterized protein LOC111445156 [Cucurbita moschata]|uniref:Uncharacterized protein LOC111445156 n=1 Tax=Cucurbita moschata TaxID=3662 RepID=A0A6J1FG13_CUCMO|nr:uncharacterized protein LOC111445156 [Cucurbita moschata]
MDYFSTKRYLFCRLKIIVSSFFGFLLHASSFRFPMQMPIQKQGPVVEAVRFSISGLKALISSQEEHQEVGQEKEDRVIRSFGIGIITSKLLTPSSSSSSIGSCNLLMDDLIGTESGVSLTENTEETEEKLTHAYFDRPHNCTNLHGFTEQNQRCVPKKQFPPPIPSLATQAGQRTRSPWILTRYYSDRRLILKLERVGNHQSMESHRENGRLILNLVPSPVPGVDNQDLQFIEEDEGNEEIDSIESEEGEDYTVPEISSESFTYGGEGVDGGVFCDRKLFCGVNGNLEERHVVHRHFDSTPLRPIVVSLSPISPFVTPHPWARPTKKMGEK